MFKKFLQKIINRAIGASRKIEIKYIYEKHSKYKSDD